MADDLTTSQTQYTRRHQRFSCNPTTVQAFVDGHEQHIEAQVVEVSKSGAQLIVAEPIPIGINVRFEIGALRVQGRVRYCKERDDKKSWSTGVLMGDVA